MTNRRQFVGFGVAVSLMPVAVPAFALPPAHSGIYKVIRDRRLAASTAFAAAMHSRGLSVHETDGDITDLWFTDLAPRWRGAPAAIAGLTAPEIAFCLEQLAWDHRMRVVFRAERIAGDDGGFAYGIEAPVPVLAPPSARRMGVADLAALAAQCPRAALISTRRAAARLPAAPEEAPRPWLSWVIAPVRRSRRLVSHAGAASGRWSRSATPGPMTGSSAR